MLTEPSSLEEPQQTGLPCPVAPHIQPPVSTLTTPSTLDNDHPPAGGERQLPVIPTPVPSPQPGQRAHDQRGHLLSNPLFVSKPWESFTNSRELTGTLFLTSGGCLLLQGTRSLLWKDSASFASEMKVHHLFYWNKTQWNRRTTHPRKVTKRSDWINASTWLWESCRNIYAYQVTMLYTSIYYSFVNSTSIKLEKSFEKVEPLLARVTRFLKIHFSSTVDM